MSEAEKEVPIWYPGVAMKQAKLAIVERAVKHCGGDKTAAARMLGIGRASIYRILKQ